MRFAQPVDRRRGNRPAGARQVANVRQRERAVRDRLVERQRHPVRRARHDTRRRRGDHTGTDLVGGQRERRREAVGGVLAVDAVAVLVHRVARRVLDRRADRQAVLTRAALLGEDHLVLRRAQTVDRRGHDCPARAGQVADVSQRERPVGDVLVERDRHPIGRPRQRAGRRGVDHARTDQIRGRCDLHRVERHRQRGLDRQRQLTVRDRHQIRLRVELTRGRRDRVDQDAFQEEHLIRLGAGGIAERDRHGVFVVGHVDDERLRPARAAESVVEVARQVRAVTAVLLGRCARPPVAL